jgi:branched-chain amino acid transport system ATP-binding protein
MTSLLAARNLQIFYGRSILAVDGVSLEVGHGGIVALLGSNGAGKSTVLKAMSGILSREGGEIAQGSMTIGDHTINEWSADRIVAHGVVHVPEGRGLFPDLSVEENLLMGGFTRSKSEVAQELEKVYQLFPRVADRRKQISGYLSGGEQQMVAIGRALMSGPRLLMLDEPSLGLAPQIIDVIFNALLKLNADTGLGILLIEQNARLALEVATYGYIMENGKVVLQGSPRELSSNADVNEFYLGFAASGERKSMRDVKHYKRRKRWAA